MTSPVAPAALLLVGPQGDERASVARALRARGLEVIQLEESALPPFLEAMSAYPLHMPRPLGVVLCPGVQPLPVSDLPCLVGTLEDEEVRWSGPVALLEVASL